MPENDLASLPNPYDFANPVSDRRLFSGRGEELKEICYYLDHGQKAPRPISIALLGARAAGKTSMLNMIELEAKDRDYCVVRVDLNEGDAESAISFFFKLFDCIFTSVCQFEPLQHVGTVSHPFGGTYGAIFDKYLDLLSGDPNLPDRSSFPFLFPVQYSRSLSTGRLAKVSEHSFRSDLQLIRKEATRPIAVLFDECNILAGHRTLLEMLRNIFMNTPGYMLVVTGTHDLFPVMDEVFSPIVRQFKRIDVVPFSKPSETEICVRKPLESIGIAEPQQVFETETLTELSHIHDLTGGRPYEIQLVCHLMFKQVQQGRTEKMRLSLGVLDDVLHELVRGHDISARPIVALVRNLTEDDLQWLALLCACDGHATMDQLWFAHRVFDSATRANTYVAAEDALNRFTAMRLLETKNGAISFAGDDFDRLYSKYYARQLGVPLSFSSLPYELYFNIKLMVFATGVGLMVSGEDIFSVYSTSTKPLAPGGDTTFESRQTEMKSENFDVARSFTKGDLARFSNETHSKLAEELFRVLLTRWMRGDTQLPLVRINIVAPTIRRSYLAYSIKSDANWNPDAVRRRFEEASARAEEFGGEFQVDISSVPVLEPEEMLQVATLSSNLELKRFVAKHMVDTMFTAYTEKNDRVRAPVLAEVARTSGVIFDADYLNNIGYLLMSNGNFGSAVQMFTLALEQEKLGEFAPLLRYNLAMCHLAIGDVGSAAKKLSELLASSDENELLCVCLFVPQYEDDVWTLRELLNIELFTTARQSLSQIHHLWNRETM